MGRRFLLAFLTLSALFWTLHAGAYRPNRVSKPRPLLLRSRTLLQDPKPEKSVADTEHPLSAERDDDDGRKPAAEAPAEVESRETRGHHSMDKSVAGGGVILGGLLTAIFAAVYCYIRVTRRRPPETLS